MNWLHAIRADVRTPCKALFALCLIAFAAFPAHATNHPIESLLGNAGFESGLTGWSYTGAGVNPNTYLTNAEWSAQSWASSSPFYTDAALAGYYPGKPWGLNPNITHIDQSTVAGDPTVVIGAPSGSNFVGSRQDGYEGHYRRDPSEPAQPAGGFYDTNFQLTSVVITGSFLAGDTFSLTVWGVRGRLRQDWGVPNANTPGSASTLSVRLTGGTFVTPAVNFANWSADGNWASEQFTWQLTANTSSIRVVLTCQNSNHDRFVATDFNSQPPLGTSKTTWGAIKALYSGKN
jgi:hypothetical protein